MQYDNFIKEWLKRSERAEVLIDDADRFISLWIAFNAWLKKEYREDTPDGKMIKKAKENEDLQSIFQRLSNNDEEFKVNLRKLMGYTVIDTRFPTNEEKEQNCIGDYKSFLSVVYLIRCNLFHGRKRVDENEKDQELVTLALKLLHPLFKEFIESKGIV
jgi:hypothetical protein